MKALACAIVAMIVLASCSAPTGNARDRYSRTQIDRIEESLIFAEIPDLGAGGLLRISGTNNGVIAWRTFDGISISLDNGVLVSTRGLGFDLMSADVSGTRAALAGATGEYSLHHSYLDGENQTVFRSFLCTMPPPASETIDVFDRNYATLRFDETCNALGLTIENTFWIGDGVVRRSRQWIGQETGYLTVDRLNE